jgi:hypothetical protein
MKKTIVIMFAVVAFSIFGFDCAKNSPASPAPTPTPSPTLFVYASCQYVSGTVNGYVQLRVGSSSGTGVTGATVKMDNQTLSESGGGDYSAGLSGITNGSTVTLTVISSQGNISASGDVPLLQGSLPNNISIPGTVIGSYFQLSNN